MTHLESFLKWTKEHNPGGVNNWGRLHARAFIHVYNDEIIIMGSVEDIETGDAITAGFDTVGDFRTLCEKIPSLYIIKPLEIIEHNDNFHDED